MLPFAGLVTEKFDGARTHSPLWAALKSRLATNLHAQDIFWVEMRRKAKKELRAQNFTSDHQLYFISCFIYATNLKDSNSRDGGRLA